MINRIPLIVSMLPLLALVLATPARAEDKVLGLFQDWGAQTFTEGGRTGCSIWSRPQKEEGDYTRRGAVYAYVTHRPWDKRVSEVSFVAGYTFGKDAEVNVQIGNTRFTLFTDGDTAWSRTAADDKKLVEAMRRGATMVVSGVSSRGTKTTDTYSLLGFSKALDTINEACKVK